MAEETPFNGAIYERTAILTQADGLRRLMNAHVFLAGVGGVGGHCAEALVRAGVGHLTMLDGDVVTATNKNRQLVALDSTVGRSKVEVLCSRLLDINSQCRITTIDGFMLPEDVPRLLARDTYTHIVDCIDSVECKVALLAEAVVKGLPVFSSGGAGNRMDPSLITTADLMDTEGDALLRACRTELRKRGVGWGHVTTVCSKEKPSAPLEPRRQDAGGRDRAINGTISYMPPMFGLYLSGLCIRAILDPLFAEKVQAARKRHAKQLDATAKVVAQRSKAAVAAGHPPKVQTGGGGSVSHGAGTKRPREVVVVTKDAE